jgi:fatty-acyl-CoA synthase
MAALVVSAGFELDAFHGQVTDRLPFYARPVFLRLVPALTLTGTFKVQTRALTAEGFDPARVADPLYFDDPTQGRYLSLDRALYERLAGGLERL